MEQAALRPYAAAGVAIVGTALIAVIPAIAPKLSNIHAQSPAVELTSTADAFLDLANALDPSASTDGLIGVANNLDSFLDLFGTPTVNVADTLTTDFIGYLGLGNEVGTIGSDVNAGFSGLDTLISGLDTDLTAPFTTLLDEVGVLTTDLTGGFSGVDSGLSTLDTALGTIDTDVVGVDSDLDLGFRNLFDALTTDLSPLSTIATELSNTGIIASDLVTLDSDLTGLLLDIIGGQ